MKVTKLYNEKTGYESYHVRYEGKSHCGNAIERSFRGKNIKLPMTVVMAMIDGTCISTVYGADGTKIEVYEA